MLAPLYLGSPQVQHSPDTWGYLVDVYRFMQDWVQQPASPQVLPSWWLMWPSWDLMNPLSHLSGQQKQVSEQPLVSDHPGRHLWFSCSGQSGPRQAPVADYWADPPAERLTSFLGSLESPLGFSNSPYPYGWEKGLLPHSQLGNGPLNVECGPGHNSQTVALQSFGLLVVTKFDIHIHWESKIWEQLGLPVDSFTLRPCVLGEPCASMVQPPVVSRKPANCGFHGME